MLCVALSANRWNGCADDWLLTTLGLRQRKQPEDLDCKCPERLWSARCVFQPERLWVLGLVRPSVDRRAAARKGGVEGFVCQK